MIHLILLAAAESTDVYLGFQSSSRISPLPTNETFNQTVTNKMRTTIIMKKDDAISIDSGKEKTILKGAINIKV